MPYSDLTASKIIADSTYVNGTRLITLQNVYPKFLNAEINTHKAPSRNSASSRAIPVEKQIQAIMDHPFVPQRFPKNQPGMSASDYWEQGSTEYSGAEYFWLAARNAAVNQVRSMIDLANVHKQTASRLLEPFMWTTAIISATLPAWEAIFVLRDHPAAQPEFQILARAMKTAIAESTPRILEWNQWHLPMLGHPGDEDLSLADQIRVSTARCARVSYLTMDNQRDVQADIDLYERLKVNGHWSPAEHPATPSPTWRHQANFHGWKQARWLVEHDADLPGEQIRSRTLASGLVAQ